jgi:hypothetical protein
MLLIVTLKTASLSIFNFSSSFIKVLRLLIETLDVL